mmetsp:Transcript_18292/g.60308  ORF Transcript_18292/g.60308 Transcript_18292/m.60308 type:complete len:203 (+) Transcript_18292:252-860(+)
MVLAQLPTPVQSSHKVRRGSHVARNLFLVLDPPQAPILGLALHAHHREEALGGRGVERHAVRATCRVEGVVGVVVVLLQQAQQVGTTHRAAVPECIAPLGVDGVHSRARAEEEPHQRGCDVPRPLCAVLRNFRLASKAEHQRGDARRVGGVGSGAALEECGGDLHVAPQRSGGERRAAVVIIAPLKGWCRACTQQPGHEPRP